MKADKACHSDLERVVRVLGVAVEEPLGRVVGMGHRKAIRVLACGDFLPVREIERNLNQGPICRNDLLVELAN